jgi:hypothetical protein
MAKTLHTHHLHLNTAVFYKQFKTEGYVNGKTLKEYVERALQRSQRISALRSDENTVS